MKRMAKDHIVFTQSFKESKYISSANAQMIIWNVLDSEMDSIDWEIVQ